jgi:glycerol-3-phosphate dehydrogenase
MVEERFDAIVIGGGIYGLMVALELASVRRRTLIVEKSDWGSGTTSAWLRILHGGLRYLQTIDLPRFYESVQERSWFIRTFPESVEPLQCIMPLYESGSRPPWMMRMALGLNDFLSMHRNRGLAPTHELRRGELLSPDVVMRRLPYIDADGLVGGACWYDAVAIQPEKLLTEILNSCQRKGVEVLKHTEAISLRVTGGVVNGLDVRDVDSGGERMVYAPLVVNAAGHWAPALAARFGFPVRQPPKQSWAWNVLFDVPCATETAGAVTARRTGAQTFFILPWRGKTLVGTGHAPANEGDDDAETVPGHLVSRFVEEVSEAVPRLGLADSKIAHVLGGRLPIGVDEPMKLTSRPMIADHSKDGAAGFHSLWGIKYTTARAEARKLVSRSVGIGG